MPALRFPTSRILPEPDPTERALFEAFAIADDFRAALRAATQTGRITQVRERIKAVVADFQALQDEADACTRTGE